MGSLGGRVSFADRRKKEDGGGRFMRGGENCLQYWGTFKEKAVIVENGKPRGKKKKKRKRD